MTSTTTSSTTGAGSSADWQQREAAVFFQAAKRVPLTIMRGEGTAVYDVEGRRYLDFVAGIATNSLGHRHPTVVEAIKAQADTLIHISNVFYSEPQVQLAELLVRHSALDRAWFCNSGAEANEAAIKLARKWGGMHKQGASEIISTENGFHGRTLAAITASGTERYKQPFAPLPGGFVVVPFNDIEAMRAAVTPHTCAILLEPIQGEGGVNLPSAGYLAAVRQLCDEQHILLILDEVQTGVGRTGTLWGYQQYGAEPDIMTLAKGLAGGVPIGAILAKEPVAACFVPGDHGSTFGGNPLATATGYSVLKFVIENDLPAEVARKGERLMRGLHGFEDRHGSIAEVRGKGLLCAVQFSRDIADQVMKQCVERGLLVNMLRANLVRFSPPLTVTDAEIDEALASFEAALKAAE
ncbi:MAG TPA: acetylornithine transaminase [Dehalococcoidia bacterium]|nr:acetylornithine transaminase [Dehalococcoidia bacterium]